MPLIKVVAVTIEAEKGENMIMSHAIENALYEKFNPDGEGPVTFGVTLIVDALDTKKKRED